MMKHLFRIGVAFLVGFIGMLVFLFFAGWFAPPAHGAVSTTRKPTVNAATCFRESQPFLDCSYRGKA